LAGETFGCVSTDQQRRRAAGGFGSGSGGAEASSRKEQALQAPTSWDMGAWGVVLSLAFGLLGIWALVQAESAGRAIRRTQKQLSCTRFIIEAGQLERAVAELDAARRSGDSGAVLAAMAAWRRATRDVRVVAPIAIASDRQLVAELTNRAISAQAECERSREAVEKGRSPSASTSSFYRSVEQVMDVVTDLRTFAEQLIMDL
jgi:hypothetical protein